MKPPDTPNLDKMLEVTVESNKIGAFLDWLLGERLPRLYICTEDEHFREDEDIADEAGITECPTCGACSEEWDEDQIFIKRSAIYGGMAGINRLLAEYFEIDYDGMERERRALLEWVRAKNEEE